MVLEHEAQRRTEALKLDGGRAAAWRRPAGERPLSTDLFRTGLVRTRQAHQEVACSFRFCRRQRRRAASIVMALEQGVGVEPEDEGPRQLRGLMSGATPDRVKVKS